MRTTSSLLTLALLFSLAPTASAQLRLPLQTLRPISTESSSSVSSSVSSVASSVESAANSSSSASLKSAKKKLMLPSSSSSSSTNSAKKNSIKTNVPLQDKSLEKYCDAIVKALNLAESVKLTGESAQKFNMSYDMLKKAEALCNAILPEVTLSEGSFSSSGSDVEVLPSGNFSSSSAGGTTVTESQFCTKLGKARGVNMCTFQCGEIKKILPCS